MSAVGRRASGCLAVSVLAIVMVVTAVAFVLSALTERSPIHNSNPVPDTVPPANGAPIPPIDTEAPGRTSLQLKEWATQLSPEVGIPVPALQAYGNAQAVAERAWPNCHLNWTTLAGLGQVETRHGSYTGKVFGGAKIDDNGQVNPHIIGIALDGSPGFAKIHDTDGGHWDGDTEYDRAVGPMQFIPETWRTVGVDGNGDGQADPHNIDDAALTAARYLCMGDRDLATPEGWTKAIFAYNQSNDYLVKVRTAAAHYALNEPA